MRVFILKSFKHYFIFTLLILLFINTNNAYSDNTLTAIRLFEVKGVKIGDLKSKVDILYGQPLDDTSFGDHYRSKKDRFVYKFKNGKVVSIGKFYPSINIPECRDGDPDFGDCSVLTNKISQMLSEQFSINFSTERKRKPTCWGHNEERHFTYNYHIYQQEDIKIEVGAMPATLTNPKKFFGDDASSKWGRVYVYYTISIDPEMNLNL